MSASARKVTVVGAGIVGAAVFERLTAAGYPTTLLDKGDVASGATRATAGVVRCFHLNPAIASRAIEGWRQYRRFASGRDDIEFIETGFLYIPAPDRVKAARETVQALESRVAMEWMDPHRVEDQFGDLLRTPSTGAVWEPGAGYVRGPQLTRALVREGCGAGGRVQERTPARSVRWRSGHVTAVSTDQGMIPSDTVVIAAGAWTPPLLDAMSVPHALSTRMVGTELRIPLDDQSSLGRCPAYVDDSVGLYGRGDLGASGVIMGLAGTSSCKADVPDPTRPTVPTRLEKLASRRFSWFRHSERRHLAQALDCFTSGGDSRWVRAVDTESGLIVAAGFGGGGLKMAPWAAGEVLRLISATTAR